MTPIPFLLLRGQSDDKDSDNHPCVTKGLEDGIQVLWSKLSTSILETFMLPRCKANLPTFSLLLFGTTWKTDTKLTPWRTKRHSQSKKRDRANKSFVQDLGRARPCLHKDLCIQSNRFHCVRSLIGLMKRSFWLVWGIMCPPNNQTVSFWL